MCSPRTCGEQGFRLTGDLWTFLVPLPENTQRTSAAEFSDSTGAATRANAAKRALHHLSAVERSGPSWSLMPLEFCEGQLKLACCATQSTAGEFESRVFRAEPKTYGLMAMPSWALPNEFEAPT